MLKHSFKPALGLLQLVMEVAYKSSHFYVVLRVFDLANRAQYQPNAAIISLVLKTLAKSKSLQRNKPEASERK